MKSGETFLTRKPFFNGKILCDFMFLIKLIIVFQNVMFIHQLLKFLW